MSPIQFYRAFKILMSEHSIRNLLTSGMACVEYGIQQNTKDTDWIIHPDDLEKLIAMLTECECGLTGKNYLVYQSEWKEFYRRWQKDTVGEWPSADPFVSQHQRLCEAVEKFSLPPAPLAEMSFRGQLYQKGIARVIALTAASSQEIAAVNPPLEIILP